MPLPPAPTQRASLMTHQAIEKSQKSSPVPTRQAASEITSKKASSKSDVAVSKADTKESMAVSPVKVRAAEPVKKPKAVKKHTGPAKLFVLDTNVLMHDPMCLFQFEEHDIYLPMIVLEELDSHKKGMTEVARNARQTSRSLDALAAEPGTDMQQGLPLSATGHIEARGKLYFQTQVMDVSLPISLPQGKADNQI